MLIDQEAAQNEITKIDGQDDWLFLSTGTQSSLTECRVEANMQKVFPVIYAQYARRGHTIIRSDSSGMRSCACIKSIKFLCFLLNACS